MKKVNVSQAKSNLSRYLKDVQRGETVLIFDRDKPVARLEPINRADIPDEDRIRDLVKRGVLIAAKRQPDVDAFLSLPRPQLPPGVSATQMIIQEREESL
jgi:antitoxin (DNA-binding transcriptional repressor) of toxin-antitoxin stability system